MPKVEKVVKNQVVEKTTDTTKATKEVKTWAVGVTNASSSSE